MNAPPHPTLPIDRTAPIALWRVAGAFLQQICNLFGAPEDIAMGVAITKGARTLMCSWLRVAEALLRRLLLVEAAAITDLPQPRPRKRKPRVRAPIVEHGDKPETWRVSFRCMVANTKTKRRRTIPRQPTHQRQPEPVEGGKRRPPLPSGHLYNAWPIAKRAEALIRVFNNPAPYARRLALRLRARPNSQTKMMRAPKDAHHKIGERDWFELATLCDEAWPLTDSS